MQDTATSSGTDVVPARLCTYLVGEGSTEPLAVRICRKMADIVHEVLDNLHMALSMEECRRGWLVCANVNVLVQSLLFTDKARRGVDLCNCLFVCLSVCAASVVS